MAKPFRRSLRQRLALMGALAVLPLMAGRGLASNYGAGIENSQWYLTDSVFECSLVHEVPGYGQAVFRHRAGEDLRLVLESDIPMMRAGNAALMVEAPAWRPGVAPESLGAVRVSSGSPALRLDHRTTMQVVQGLLNGMQPTVTRQSRYGQGPVRVHFSNINFASAWRGYRACTAALLPVNYDQVRRTRIPFASGSLNLSALDKQRLENIATFVLADPTVERVFVDGHSDSIGSRIDNRALSEERANVVADYLQSQGIDASMMTVRAHADQFPASRRPADNRRVNIRLQRQGERPEFQQASAPYDDTSG